MILTHKQEVQKAYYDTHRESIAKKHKEWVLAHPEETVLQNRRKQAKYKRTIKGKYRSLTDTAKFRKLILTISLEAYISLIENPCYYCGGELPSAGHGLDRIDNTLGYTIENVRPCCSNCNSAKLDLTEIEFKAWIINAYNNFASKDQNA